MKRIAVYAGTFDPPTLGHTYMIEEAARLFDEVIVAIGVNPDKKTMFSVNERLLMLREVTHQFPNVKISSFGNEYLIHYAVSVGANFIIRGIRNTADFEYERAMRNINSDLGPEITSVFLMPPREIAEISSSVVKGLIGPSGWEKVVERYVPPSVFEKFLARKHWTKLMHKLGNPKGNEKILEDLLLRYGEPHRAYHTLTHILRMLEEFDLVRDKVKNPVAVEIALWFHDAVYDPKAKDNEEQSAKLARLAIGKLGLDSKLDATVVRLILATKHTSVPIEHDSRFLVDLDLSILGKSEEEFDEYEHGIRKEYEWVSETDFKTGRTKILQSFLERPSIYSTEFFETRNENTARINLARSIEKLNM